MYRLIRPVGPTLGNVRIIMIRIQKIMVPEGVPYETINALAAKDKADLIVINLQNKGRLERAVLGTTAERVIRTATVPVLSLPLPALYASRWSAA